MHQKQGFSTPAAEEIRAMIVFFRQYGGDIQGLQGRYIYRRLKTYKWTS